MSSKTEEKLATGAQLLLEALEKEGVEVILVILVVLFYLFMMHSMTVKFRIF